MPTYPLTFPTIGVTNSNFMLRSASATQESPFTLRQQVYLNPGKRWEGSVTLRAMTHADVGQVKAFLADLQGSFGTFLYGDPDYLAKGANGALGGTPLVKGAAQTGNTLEIDGCTATVSNWGAKGDYFHLGTGTSQRLYMLTENCNTNSAGETTLTFQPSIRSSPGDNAAVTFTGAKGLMRLAGNVAEWQANQSSIYEVSFDFVEAFSE